LGIEIKIDIYNKDIKWQIENYLKDYRDYFHLML